MSDLTGPNGSGGSLSEHTLLMTTRSSFHFADMYGQHAIDRKTCT
jgi:hypothetical protein